MSYIRLSTGALKSHFHFDFNQDERCTWYELLLISRDSLYPGYLQQSEGQGYPIDWLAGQLGIPIGKAHRHIQKFIDDGSLTENLCGCLKIVNWEKFQPKYSKYQDGESSQHGKASKIKTSSDDFLDPELAAVAKCYEENFGQPLSATIRDILVDYCEMYTGKLTEEAIIEAVKQGKRSLSYVEGIAKQCKEKGTHPGSNHRKTASAPPKEYEDV